MLMGCINSVMQKWCLLQLSGAASVTISLQGFLYCFIRNFRELIPCNQFPLILCREANTEGKDRHCCNCGHGQVLCSRSSYWTNESKYISLDIHLMLQLWQLSWKIGWPKLPSALPDGAYRQPRACSGWSMASDPRKHCGLRLCFMTCLVAPDRSRKLAQAKSRYTNTGAGR